MTARLFFDCENDLNGTSDIKKITAIDFFMGQSISKKNLIYVFQLS